MTTDGLADFSDRYHALLVTACEWRAMQADPEVLAGRVLAALRESPAAPNLHTAYEVLDKVVLDSYLEASGSVSILDKLRGSKQSVANAPQDTPEESKLRDAVSRLRRKDRELLQLAYWDELGESELVQVLAADAQSVTTRREHALAAYQVLVRKLSPSTDAAEPSRLFRSVKPGIHTRWQ